MVERGAALSIKQNVVTGQMLLTLIYQLYQERKTIKQQLKNLAHFVIMDSARKIVAVVESVR
ncbi:TPA: hypothetical protein DIV55_02200 [Patescibacteria group bacterium]|nr:hypothetical protein [Patescibacteria group bacterium]